MGELMRRFWIPSLMEEEVAEPDGASHFDPDLVRIFHEIFGKILIIKNDYAD